MVQKKINLNKLAFSLFFAGVILIAGFIFLDDYKKVTSAVDSKDKIQKKIEQKQQNEINMVTGSIEKFFVMDFNKPGKDKNNSDLMDQRKQNLDIENSLDMIVKSDESFKIGKITVSMKDIMEKSFLKNRKIFEEKIHESGETEPEEIENYGIYIVRPGDNLWNIHFKIIRAYYNSKGISISANADEPFEDKLSSGIGKVLKFSEKLVIIFNLMENKVDTDINLLTPLSKIVVYNMNEVFALFKKINYKNVDKIRFDGETIWIPQNNNHNKKW
ncbi:MAG: hypothetical protein U9N77_06565 [Thermodesulfobacteriota bacterium]|nr:hypothetical protein [Thermodesulfobacteriota bacterium]